MALRLIRTRSPGNHYATEGFTLDIPALEPGDKLAVARDRRLGVTVVEFYTVVRRTATQIVCESAQWQTETRFRADGSQVGDTHTPMLRAPFDPRVLDALEAIRTEQYMHQIHKSWSTANRSGPTKLVRDMFPAEVAGLTAQFQTDLVRIRSAGVEWHALKEVATDAGS